METLLRICASGVVGYTATSPSCSEYSRLKLKPGGPPALRSPEHLEGLPGLAPSDLLKVQDSHTILVNCIEALMITYSSGGDGHLEQPTTAMSWSEPCVQQWLMTAACHCINLPACNYGADWQKSWMMASSLEALTSLAGMCNHGPCAHQSVAGVRNASGVFVSRATAEYPSMLASRFAEVVFPLLSHSNQDFSITDCLKILPIKRLLDAPLLLNEIGGWRHLSIPRFLAHYHVFGLYFPRSKGMKSWRFDDWSTGQPQNLPNSQSSTKVSQLLVSNLFVLFTPKAQNHGGFHDPINLTCKHIFSKWVVQPTTNKIHSSKLT